MAPNRVHRLHMCRPSTSAAADVDLQLQPNFTFRLALVANIECRKSDLASQAPMVLRLSDLGSMKPRVLRLEQKDDRDDDFRCVDDIVHSNCEEPQSCRDRPREVHSKEEITQKNQTDSPLLCLPAEIRNQIYRLVFTGAVIAINKPYTRKENVLTTYPSVRGFMYTCYQAYWEAEMYMFGLTLFVPSYFALRFLWSSNMCAAGIGSIRGCKITSGNAQAIIEGRIKKEDLQCYSSLRRIFVQLWRPGMSVRRGIQYAEALRTAFGIPDLYIKFLK